jgi:hypothetical protein
LACPADKEENGQMTLSAVVRSKPGHDNPRPGLAEQKLSKKAGKLLALRKQQQGGTR